MIYVRRALHLAVQLDESRYLTKRNVTKDFQKLLRINSRDFKNHKHVHHLIND